MSLITPNQAQLDDILRRGVAEVILEEEFIQLLHADRPLRLKQGFDPSAPDIHLGHVVGLRKLGQLQKLGHQVVLVVGDWTAQIGDPSGQSVTRPMLSATEVKANAETYMDQFFRVVDRDKTEVRWQTEWFGTFSLTDVLRLASRFTVAQVLRRDDFSKRFQEERPIVITELLYPLLQAYDSVMVEADVEFGGTDQRFNNLLGRELQGMMGQRPQQVFLVPLLVGTDGVNKMSKSLGNHIGVTDPPNEMYGKAMSISDPMILPYLELVTALSNEQVEEFRHQLQNDSVNPMNLKKRLAREIVTQFHGAEASTAAQTHFERVVQRKETPEELPVIRLLFSDPMQGPNNDVVATPESPGTVKVNIAKLVAKAGLAPSSSEARRLLGQGAIHLDGRQLEPNELVVPVSPRSIIRVGTRRYLQVEDSGQRA